MKKEVAVCDICNDRVAKKVCAICGKDICIYCGKDWRTLLNQDNQIFIPFCKTCLNNKYDKDILEEIKKDIVEKMKRGRIIQNLT